MILKYLPGTKSTHGRVIYYSYFISIIALVFTLGLNAQNSMYLALGWLLYTIFLAYHVSCLVNGGCTWYATLNLIIPVLLAGLLLYVSIQKSTEDTNNSFT